MSIIIAVRNCHPVLDLTFYPDSWTWTSIKAPPFNNGILFNIDQNKEENVVFIGSHESNTKSEVYMVIMHDTVDSAY